MRIKLFEEFSEWDRDVFLLDLYAMSSTEVENLFWEEIEGETPHIEKIEGMIESGLVDLDAKNGNGETPLHWASRYNLIETAKLLLEAGADVKAKNYDGETPLYWACWYDNFEVAKLLLDRGADVEAKDNYGLAPLHWASKNGRIETAKLLIDAGAEVEAEDEYGRTPLDLAQSNEMRALLGGGL